MNLRYMTNICCRLSLILIALFFLVACGGGGGDSGQTQNASNYVSYRDGDLDRLCAEDDKDCGDNDGTNGASLYQNYCSSCHGSLSNSEVRDASAGDIEDAIDDINEMDSLEFLRSYQIEAIADALSGDGSGGGGGTAAVNYIAIHNPSSPQYDDNCLNCHGDISNSQSLNPAIPNAHVAMLAFTPGEDSDRCVWCHRDVSNTLIHTAAQVGTFQTNIRKTVDTQLCGICHGPVGPGKPFYQSGLTTSADPDGSQLYLYLCSACHRELANSEVNGESTQDIYDAIASNEGGMSPLSVLNPTWIQAITVALGGDPTLPTNIPAPNTGSSLYQQYCSSCHGTLANSAKAGATEAQIQNGINTVNEMSALSFLTSTQVQAIADALSGGGGGTGGGGTGGTDGAALYAQYCEACHNSLANSNQSGASAALIQNGINNVNEMSSLSFLTSTQVQAIADALSGGGGGTGGGGTGGTDGAALYAQYCETCHNSLANSNQSGASAALIQNGINNVNEMSSLSFLTSTQVQAIADALSGGGVGTGGGGGTDGESLYAQYCSACHRNLDDSEVRGEGKGNIEDAIYDNEGGMGALGFLSEDQIEAIADALDGDL